MPSTSIIDRLRGERDGLAEGFAEAILVEGGRRGGGAKTRIAIDLRHPNVADDAEQDRLARWRLRSARHRLARASFSRDVLATFYDADAHKGQRLTAVDLRNHSRVAALMGLALRATTASGWLSVLIAQEEVTGESIGPLSVIPGSCHRRPMTGTGAG